jgi:hypothetical protein
MNGLMITLTPHTWAPQVRELECEPPLDEIKAGIGGGWLEAVPGFTSITVRGSPMPCVAFCDEDGKRKNLPVNVPATILWDRSLCDQGLPGVAEQYGRSVNWRDWLVGSVVVLAGDAEFMRSLREDHDAG